MCRGIWIWCPGCDKAHRIRVPLEDGSFDAQPIWEWTGTTDETFTISPSLLIWTGDRNKPAPGDRRCHSYIKNGVWDFLTDSNHSLAGKKVPMVPVPDWIARREH